MLLKIGLFIILAAYVCASESGGNRADLMGEESNVSPHIEQNAQNQEFDQEKASGEIVENRIHAPPQIHYPGPAFDLQLGAGHQPIALQLPPLLQQNTEHHVNYQNHQPAHGAPHILPHGPAPVYQPPGPVPLLQHESQHHFPQAPNEHVQQELIPVQNEEHHHEPSHDPAGPQGTAVAVSNQDHNEAWPLAQPDVAKIVHLDVKCEKNLMKVVVEFDRPFHGLIFSKGHYSYGNCVHLPAGSGRKSVFFDISINSCGTVGNAQNGLYGQEGNTATGSFFENTIIIQYDAQVQEVWDQARKLRCTWHNNYEKSVTFRPFPVDMLDVVRADFAGDNVGCWMQIQAGKGPWAQEVAGIVKIGQTMTMVLAIKDDENKFDMLVRNCIAHDGQRAPIELVDSQGCITRPKLMSKFTKIRNFGSSATVLSYAHFQAFKFPDTMEVHFQCTIQICRYQCPDQCSGQIGHAETSASDKQILYSHNQILSRQEREIAMENGETEIGVNRIIRVLSAGDVDFSLGNETSSLEYISEPMSSIICMSTLGFVGALLTLLTLLIVSCLTAAFLWIKHKSLQSPAIIGFPYDLPVFKKTKQ